MQDIGKLIKALNDRGLRVNNLFQIDEGWRCNVTDGEKYYDFVNAVSIDKALALALERAPVPDDTDDLA